MSRPELSTSAAEELAALPTAHTATNGSAGAASDQGTVATGGDEGIPPARTPPARSPHAGASCAECGAPLAADQRYCLACGRPASPVRLAFLDVLQAEQPPGTPGARSAAAAAQVPSYYAPPEPDGLLGALRRYSGLLALVGVLLASLLIGLLVGHWITGNNGGAAPAKQVVEVKGLGALAAVPASAAGSATPNASSSSGSGSKHGATAKSAQTEAKQEVQEVKEVKAAKAPPPVHKKTTAQSLQKLGKSTGKQHAKEVNELIKGDEPIETGH